MAQAGGATDVFGICRPRKLLYHMDGRSRRKVMPCSTLSSIADTHIWG